MKKILDETTKTVEQQMVEDLVQKIEPGHGREETFTFLHDHECKTLTDFILDHNPLDENALDAKNKQPYNLIELSRTASSYL